jgi:hypothetical protein
MAQELRKNIELRRLIKFNNKSESLGFTIPAEWCEQMQLEPKQYIKLEMDEDGNGFHVARILFQEV